LIGEREFFYYLERERKKLEKVFENLDFIDEEYGSFIKAYWEDANYFYSNKDYVKAFELIMYIWGWLDCLINEGKIKVKNKELIKWFKIVKERTL